MEDNPYKIVFVKLQEAVEETKTSEEAQSITILSRDELDEIDELRRLAMEIQEPEPRYFTTT